MLVCLGTPSTTLPSSGEDGQQLPLQLGPQNKHLGIRAPPHPEVRQMLITVCHGDCVNACYAAAAD